MVQRNSKQLFLLIHLAIFLFTSCDVSNSEEFRDTFSYQISEQSVIQTDTMQRLDRPDSLSVQTFSVEPGDSSVFIFEHNQIPPDDVLDGGFFETLVFQIPSETDRFEFRDQELGQANTLYFQSSAFQFIGTFVTSGLIRGEQLSPVHWIVRADVTIESNAGTSQVELEEPFYVE